MSAMFFIDAEIDISYNKEFWLGKGRTAMPFMPYPGLHFGESTVVTAASVHWLGQGQVKIHCASIDDFDSKEWKSLEVIKKAVIASGIRFEFEKVR